jgi:hypothetical protein
VLLAFAVDVSGVLRHSLFVYGDRRDIAPMSGVVAEVMFLGQRSDELLKFVSKGQTHTRVEL